MADEMNALNTSDLSRKSRDQKRLVYSQTHRRKRSTFSEERDGDKGHANARGAASGTIIYTRRAGS